MKNSMINEIYFNIVQTAFYMNDDACKRNIIKTQKTNMNIRNLVGDGLYLKIEEFISEELAGAEQTGFIVGFKCAIHLMSECGFKEMKVSV